MCDESYAGQALGGPTPGTSYNNLKDEDSRVRQQGNLKHGPSLRRQLEQTLLQTDRQRAQTAEALVLLTPEVEKMIEAFRALNRLGMLQL